MIQVLVEVVNYVFELEQHFSRRPHQNPDGSYVVEFALGYDLPSSLIIVMSVMLIPDESGAFELCFGVRRRGAADPSKVSPPDYSAASAKRFVPSEAAPRVLECILEAIVALVMTGKPKQVVMETFESRLPPKAMKKYERVTAAMRRLGYKVEFQFRNEIDGKDYWLYVSSS